MPSSVKHSLVTGASAVQRLAVALLLAACPALLMVSPPAQARDLQGRLGLGYNSEFVSTSLGTRIPGVSVKYALTRDVAGEAIFGLSTGTPSYTMTGFKGFKNLFFETNLNFYTMVGLGFISANSKSGIQLLGGFGAEFFIPGVESVGLSLETGASLDNVSGSFSFKTLGASFLEAGMHFYF